MRRLITTIALVTLGSSAMAGNEQKVYKWTDDEGNVHFSDSIPAEHAERSKEVLNDHGVTVGELEGKKTAEQLEQERIEKDQRVAQELQRRADQALLATYLSVEEIIMHRDRRVELFLAQSRVTELYLSNLDRRLQLLRKDASKYKPYSDDSDAPMIDESLAEELHATEDAISRHEQNLEKYKADERQIIERFNGDIKRFKILKGIDNESGLGEEMNTSEQTASASP